MEAKRTKPIAYPFEDVVLNAELIDEFVSVMADRGAAAGTLETYRRRMELIYTLLPDDKRIQRGTVDACVKMLHEKGYAKRTINNAVSIVNSFLAWLGKRELQGDLMRSAHEEIQPELTRNEYLRLLTTARNLGKEKTYLLIKIFATTNLGVQNLSKLTVEAVQENRVLITANGCQKMIHFPECIRLELLRYCQQNLIRRGPIFVTKNGTPLKRTTVSTMIGRICHDAQVPQEKGNPRCLKKLYQTTQANIEANIALLVEQAHDRMIETEQLTVGWDFEKASGL